jgi:ascorbate-specific PTS system EIIC-type component UlaA
MNTKPMIVLGMVLVVACMIVLIYQGVNSFTSDAGAPDPLYAILGGCGLAAGIVLILVGARLRRRDIANAPSLTSRR